MNKVEQIVAPPPPPHELDRLPRRWAALSDEVEACEQSGTKFCQQKLSVRDKRKPQNGAETKWLWS